MSAFPVLPSVLVFPAFCELCSCLVQEASSPKNFIMMALGGLSLVSVFSYLLGRSSAPKVAMAGTVTFHHLPRLRIVCIARQARCTVTATASSYNSHHWPTQHGFGGLLFPAWPLEGNGC